MCIIIEIPQFQLKIMKKSTNFFNFTRFFMSCAQIKSLQDEPETYDLKSKRC